MTTDDSHNGSDSQCRLSDQISANTDYSFRPDDVQLTGVVRWATEFNNVCADEYLIDPTPDPGIAEWYACRYAETEAKLTVLRELCIRGQFRF